MIAGRTGSRVAAFECEPTCARSMERNFQLNPRLEGLLDAVEATVGDAADETGIDDYASSERGFVPDFIKIDVDGGELWSTSLGAPTSHRAPTSADRRNSLGGAGARMRGRTR